MPESDLPMFFFKSFIVSGLTFRYLIHFNFIFVYGTIKFSDFILLQMCDQFQAPVVEYTVFSPLYFLHFCLLGQR